MSGRWKHFFIPLALVAPCVAQQPEASVRETLATLTQRAGVIFAGEVTAIRPLPGIVEVEFRVDQSLKAATGTYVLREWSGLWAAGQRRYWLGERAIFFFNPTSASGFSTPVDGMDGILPLTGNTVDMHRLSTRVQREIGQPLPSSAETLESIAATVAAQLPPPVPVKARPIIPRPLPPAPRPVKNLPSTWKVQNATY